MIKTTVINILIIIALVTSIASFVNNFYHNMRMQDIYNLELEKLKLENQILKLKNDVLKSKNDNGCENE